MANIANVTLNVLWRLFISSNHPINSIFTYSVMQSDGNSFGGDVVLDSFNMVYSNEDSI